MKKTVFISIVLLCAYFFTCWLFANFEVKKKEQRLINPLVSSGIKPKVVYARLEVKEEKIDALISKYAKKYANADYPEGYLKQLLHCLCYRESKYGKDKGFGDQGKAGGLLQFHEPTYKSYREIMIKRGLVYSSGSRMNYEQAIETTVWAISDGRGKAWGPFLRQECE